MSQEPACILFVRMTIKTGEEDAFNAWYENEYIPAFVRDIPGITEARRYVSLSPDEQGALTYLTTYEFGSEAALQRGMEVMKSRDAWRKAWTEWERRAVASISDGLFRATVSLPDSAKS